MSSDPSHLTIDAAPDPASPAARALRVFELDQELRADREPPLSCEEWEAKHRERLRLLESLGWRPNGGR